MSKNLRYCTYRKRDCTSECKDTHPHDPNFCWIRDFEKLSRQEKDELATSVLSPTKEEEEAFRQIEKKQQRSLAQAEMVHNMINQYTDAEWTLFRRMLGTLTAITLYVFDSPRKRSQ